MAKFTPLHDRILVRRVEESETTRGGIIIPDSAKDKPQEGEVISAGKGKVNEDGKVRPLDVKEGDRILFGKYSGTEIKLDVEVYSISATGQLTELNDYTNTNGLNSNNVMLSADGTLLYVSETASNQVETLTTGANGALTYDSVVSLKVEQFNSTLGMATVQSGKGIFVAEDSPAQIAVLGAHGTSLKEVANSPFSLNDNFAFVIGIAAVPGKSCH